MIRKYFYLINYIIDRTLFGYKGQVFCMEPKQAVRSCYMKTLLGKPIYYKKGKRYFSKRIHYHPSFPYFDPNSATLYTQSSSIAIVTPCLVV